MVTNRSDLLRETTKCVCAWTTLNISQQNILKGKMGFVSGLSMDGFSDEQDCE